MAIGEFTKREINYKKRETKNKEKEIDEEAPINNARLVDSLDLIFSNFKKSRFSKRVLQRIV